MCVCVHVCVSVCLCQYYRLANIVLLLRLMKQSNPTAVQGTGAGWEVNTQLAQESSSVSVCVCVCDWSLKTVWSFTLWMPCRFIIIQIMQSIQGKNIVLIILLEWDNMRRDIIPHYSGSGSVGQCRHFLTPPSLALSVLKSFSYLNSRRWT